MQDTALSGAIVAARLGHVLYWLSAIIAVGWPAMALVYYELKSALDASLKDPVLFGTTFGIPVIILGIGWTARYILSGDQ